MKRDIMFDIWAGVIIGLIISLSIDVFKIRTDVRDMKKALVKEKVEAQK